MTPKEKATDLFKQFYDLTPNEAFFNEPIVLTEHYSAALLAKKCALITVEEILKSREIFTDYWQEVKEEILEQYKNI